MPGRDGTGPMGQGSVTGRGLGFCTGVNARKYSNSLRRGFGYRMGLNYGCRRSTEGYYAGQSGLTDKELLSEQKDILQRRLDEISEQLKNL